MKNFVTFLFFSFFLFNSTIFSQIILSGILLDDNSVIQPNIKIGVAGGSFDITDSKGQFQIKLSKDFREGARIIFIVHKSGWIINDPVDGHWNVPDIREQNVNTKNVVIVPKGSMKLWTNNRIKKYLADYSNEITKLKRERDRPNDIGIVLHKWAKATGFESNDIRSIFDKWVESQENSSDYRTLGLREFYKNNFYSAAQNFTLAAKQNKKNIDTYIKGEAYYKSKRINEVLEIIRNFKYAGNSFFNLYDYKSALANYDSAAIYIDRNIHNEEWIEISNLIANVYFSLGIRKAGIESHNYLKSALKIYESLGNHNGIGNTLVQIGIRESSSESREYLLKAFKNYRLLLDETNKISNPEIWSAININMSITSRHLASYSSQYESKKYINEAIKYNENAISVLSPTQTPFTWAGAQNNLAGIYFDLGSNIAGIESINFLFKSLNIYFDILRVYSFVNHPQDWASTYNNIGSTYKNISLQKDGRESLEYLQKSIESFVNASTVFNKNNAPQMWAKIKDNIGISQREFGLRTEGKVSLNYLAKSICSHQEVLEVHSKKYLPQLWAQTKCNLGMAYIEYGRKLVGDSSNVYLQNAIVELDSALQVLTLVDLPQIWSIAQNNKGIAYRMLARQSQKKEALNYLISSIAAYDSSLLGITKNTSSQDWARSQNNLGNTLTDLSELVSDTEEWNYLHLAKSAIDSAFKIYDQTHFPQQWAGSKNNLGRIYRKLGDVSSRKEKNNYYQKSMEAYQCALEIFNKANFPQQWAIVHFNQAILYTQIIPNDQTTLNYYYKKAVSKLDSALLIRTPQNNSKQFIMTMKLKGNILTKMKRFNEAISSYKLIIEYFPEFENELINIAFTYRNRHYEYNHSFELLKLVSQNDRNKNLLTFSIAEGYFTLNQFSICDSLLSNISSFPNDESRLVSSLLKISSFTVQKKYNDAKKEIDNFIILLSSKQFTISLGWDFSGLINFIRTNVRDNEFKYWLLTLFKKVKLEIGTNTYSSITSHLNYYPSN